jgi:hypothetical protein
MNGSIRRGALLVCLLLGVLPAALPAANVRMLSTGVGKEDRVAQTGYSLLIVFATGKGHLVANVSVEVKDSAGTIVVQTVSEGPWLFLGLQPGEYRVTAKLGSRTTGAAVSVPESGQQRLWLAL